MSRQQRKTKPQAVLYGTDYEMEEGEGDPLGYGGGEEEGEEEEGEEDDDDQVHPSSVTPPSTNPIDVTEFTAQLGPQDLATLENVLRSEQGREILQTLALQTTPPPPPLHNYQSTTNLGRPFIQLMDHNYSLAPDNAPLTPPLVTVTLRSEVKTKSPEPPPGGSRGSGSGGPGETPPHPHDHGDENEKRRENGNGNEGSQGRESELQSDVLVVFTPPPPPPPRPGRGGRGGYRGRSVGRVGVWEEDGSPLSQSQPPSPSPSLQHTDTESESDSHGLSAVENIRRSARQQDRVERQEARRILAENKEMLQKEKEMERMSGSGGKGAGPSTVRPPSSPIPPIDLPPRDSTPPSTPTPVPTTPVTPTQGPSLLSPPPTIPTPIATPMAIESPGTPRLIIDESRTGKRPYPKRENRKAPAHLADPNFTREEGEESGGGELNGGSKTKDKSAKDKSGKVKEEEEEDEEKDDDDPDKLWCICREPHNNRFMICCDGCEDWFHGKCVGVTRAQGKTFEDQGINWLCPPCKKTKKVEAAVEKKLLQVGKKLVQAVKKRKPPTPTPSSSSSSKDKDKEKNKEKEKEGSGTATGKKRVKRSAPTPKPSAESKPKSLNLSRSFIPRTKEKNVILRKKILIQKMREDMEMRAMAKYKTKGQGQGVIIPPPIIPPLTPPVSVKEEKKRKVVTQSHLTPGQGKGSSKGGRTGVTGGESPYSRRKSKLITKMERCMVCGAPARPDSVFCSNDCVVRHSDKTFSKPRTPPPPPNTPSTPIIKTSIKRKLSVKSEGDVEEMENFLTFHLISTKPSEGPGVGGSRPPTTRPTPSPSGGREGERRGSLSKPTPTKIPKLSMTGTGTGGGTGTGRGVGGRGAEELKPKTPITLLKKLPVSTPTPTPTPSRGKKTEEGKGRTSSERRDSGGQKGPRRLSGGETLRRGEERGEGQGSLAALSENMRKGIREILEKRSDDVKMNDPLGVLVILGVGSPALIAEEIERELVMCFGTSTNPKCRNKYRSILFNLKDPKNCMFMDLLSGKLMAKDLVRMEAHQMASAELTEWRTRENEKELEAIKRFEIDKLAEAKKQVLIDAGTEFDKVATVEKEARSMTIKDVITTESSDSDPSQLITQSPVTVTALLSNQTKTSTTTRTTTTPSTVGVNKSSHSSSRSQDKDKDKDKRSKSKDEKGRDHRRSSTSTREREGEREHHRSSGKSGESGRSTRQSTATAKDKDKDKGSDRKGINERDKDKGKGKDKKKEKESSSRDKGKDKGKEKDRHSTSSSKQDGRKSESERKEGGGGGSGGSGSGSGRGMSRRHKSTESEQELPSSTVKTPDLDEGHGLSGGSGGSGQRSKDLKDLAPILVTKLVMPELGQFNAKVFNVSHESVDGIFFPETPVPIVGRISPDIVWDYIDKMKKNKELIVLRLAPDKATDEVTYMNFFSYLSARSRFGVLGGISSPLKDVYLIPLDKFQAINRTLLPFRGPGLPKDREHCLLAVVTRHTVEVKAVKRKPLSASKMELEKKKQRVSPRTLVKNLTDVVRTGTGMRRASEGLTPSGDMKTPSTDDDTPYTPWEAEDEDDGVDGLEVDGVVVMSSGSGSGSGGQEKKTQAELMLEELTLKIEKEKEEIETMAMTMSKNRERERIPGLDGEFLPPPPPPSTGGDLWEGFKGDVDMREMGGGGQGSSGTH